MNFEYMPELELALRLPAGAAGHRARLRAALPRLQAQRLALAAALGRAPLCAIRRHPRADDGARAHSHAASAAAIRASSVAGRCRSAAVTKTTRPAGLPQPVEAPPVLGELPVLGVPQPVVLERDLPLRPGEVDPRDEATAVAVTRYCATGARQPAAAAISSRSRVSCGDSASPSAQRADRSAPAARPRPARGRRDGSDLRQVDDARRDHLVDGDDGVVPRQQPRRAARPSPPARRHAGRRGGAHRCRAGSAARRTPQARDAGAGAIRGGTVTSTSSSGADQVDAPQHRRAPPGDHRVRQEEQAAARPAARG